MESLSQGWLLGEPKRRRRRTLAAAFIGFEKQIIGKLLVRNNTNVCDVEPKRVPSLGSDCFEKSIFGCLCGEWYRGEATWEGSLIRGLKQGSVWEWLLWPWRKGGGTSLSTQRTRDTGRAHYKMEAFGHMLAWCVYGEMGTLTHCWRCQGLRQPLWETFGEFKNAHIL